MRKDWHSEHVGEGVVAIASDERFEDKVDGLS